MDEDYSVVSSPFVYSIGPGDMVECPSIYIENDRLLEGEQQFSVTILSTNLESQIGSSHILVKIIDDEGICFSGVYEGCGKGKTIGRT